MDKYISDLIEIILAAYQNRPERQSNVFDEEDDIFADVETYLAGGFPPVHEGFGIPQHYFPPADKLTDEQIDRLLPEFEALWYHFRFDLCFPKKINNRWKYFLLRRDLNESHMIPTYDGSISGIEFCHYDPTDCDLPREFCCCNNEDLNED